MNILFRYTGVPLEPEFGAFTGHAGKWCWWCIGDILQTLGRITPIDWNEPFTPSGVYDAIFSIQHLNGLTGAFDGHTKKIVRLTMSDPNYHNRAIREQVYNASMRRDTKFELRRLLPENDNRLDLADVILMNGNEHNKRTYPKELWSKIITMNTCASNVGDVELRDEIKGRGFLFHAGSGAIHKGLDLALEAFAKHPEWELHITANLRNEPDFMREYAKELSLPNIHYHGWVVVSSPLFQSILDKCIAFINPTCSEGQSPAVATCLTLGLYPIISRYTGIDLPDRCGIYLDELTVDGVEEGVEEFLFLNDDEILDEISVIQSDAMVRYSRDAFRENMTKVLKEALCVT